MDIPGISNQDRSHTQFSPTTGQDMDGSNGPRAKQRRYEDGMSSKLGNIHISPNKEQRENRPFIEEINWDEEFLDDYTEELLRQANSAPIVETPSTTPTLEEQQQGTSGSTAANASSSSHKHTVNHVIIEELNPALIEEDLLEEGKKIQQKIVLSQELRQLLQNCNNADPLLLEKTMLRQSKELVPYVPSPLLSQIIASKTSTQVEEREAEEVLDDEVFPDAANTPRVESSAEDSEELPTPPMDAILTGDETREGDDDEDEEAMDMD